MVVRRAFCSVAVLASALAAAVAGALGAGCVPRPRMCEAPVDCGGGPSDVACVAGRCQPRAGTPTIQGARRLLVSPSELAYVRRHGDGPVDGVPPGLAILGSEAVGDAVLLARFPLSLPRDARVVEAYVLLERSDAVAGAPVSVGPTPLSLHLANVAQPWDSRSMSWARLPRIEDGASPATSVDPAGAGVVRLDAREIVERWRAARARSHGVAVIASGSTPEGMALATVTGTRGTEGVPGGTEAAGSDDEPSEGNVLHVGPRLEVYWR